MSETLGQDPDGLGAAYTTLAPNYPSTPATPSSTVQDVPPGSNLPPFSTFSSDMDPSATFNNDRLFGDTRLLDISNWDYYADGRILERGENGLSIITSQPQYRPWESKSVEASMSATTPVNTFSDAFAQQPKLPSFQSQFQSFNDAVTTSETTLTTLTNLTPVSPNSTSSPQSQSLTPLNSSFHTLSAVNPRSYPLVPAPIQAREIPSIQQQFLDERHIQLYSHPTTNIIHNNTLHSASIFPQNGTIIQSPQIISSPTVVTVLKSEPELKLTPLNSDTGIKIHQNVTLHPTQFQNPMTTLNATDNGLFNGIEKKINQIGHTMSSPTRNDFRKKERRKIRASSLESSAESDGASSNMDINNENSGQVAAVSSTDNGYKTNANLSMGMEHDLSCGPMDKQVKKKRKRCGECVGCQRKDNCGDCAPCRNDKSHQICKLRRCEKLTEKKNLFGEPYMREGGKGRGRGRGRGGGSYRGRKPNGSIAPLGSASGGIPPPIESDGASVAPPQQVQTRLSPQLTTAVQPMPVQQQPMTPMPFYADPNRFGTPVWQTDPTQGWTQGQFIQQIPTTGQPIETYQQYSNGIYQATYQQPSFETTNTFYTTQPVQLLTNARPPSVPNQQAQMIPARPNSNYVHTPSPSPANNQQNQNQQYNQFNGQNGNDSNSRPSSVNSVVNQNPGTPNQNFNQQQTLVNQQSFSPSPNQQGQFVTGSGNGQPGYPQVNANSPQTSASHNSSGYPGQEQYGGQQNNQQQAWQQQQQEQQMLWEQQQQQHQRQSHDVEIENDQQQNYQQVNEQQHQEQYNNMNHHQQQQNQNHSPVKSQSEHQQKTFSQADKINLNTRIKTMILNKQQQQDDEMKSSNEQQNNTGHFLWYSHHPHVKANRDDGGPKFKSDIKGLPKPNNTQEIAQINSKASSNTNYKNFSKNIHKNDNYNDQYLKYVQDSALEKKEVKALTTTSIKNNQNQLTHQQISTFDTSKIVAPVIKNVHQNYSKKNVAILTRDARQDQTHDYHTDTDVNYVHKSNHRHNTNHSLPRNTLDLDQNQEAIKNQPSSNILPGNHVQNQHIKGRQNFENLFQNQSSYDEINSRFNPEQNLPPSPSRSQSNLNQQSSHINIDMLGQNSPKTPAQEIEKNSYAASFLKNQRDNLNFKNLSNSESKPFECSSEGNPIFDNLNHNQMTHHPVIKKELFDPQQGTSSNSFPLSPTYSKIKKEEYQYSYSSPLDVTLKDPWAQEKYRNWTPLPHSIPRTTPDPQYFLSPVKREKGYPTPPYTPKSDCGSPQKSPYGQQMLQSPNNMNFSYPIIDGNNHRKPKVEKQTPPSKMGEDIPKCFCIPKDKQPSTEPGTYYTHLGCANNLKTLRHNLECQTGVNGAAIRIEKVRYTGKEGKTAQGCPIVKWVHRRVNLKEKYLVIVKHRTGHSCHSAFIIICLVVWEGIPRDTADDLYSTLTEKLNKFGLPTKRRCATNDTRTCACQGIDEDTCGASFSFGCSWSMYYNGCKFTRSKDVRKFRFSVKEEEASIENKFIQLADHINPLYKRLAPNSFANQTRFEDIASDCRLGSNPGRPFSGVTACIDFCAHAHKDIHNMNNGCTVVVSLTKHRELSKPDDEQLHVLPMYVPDETDEFDSKENQDAKVKNGQVEVLNRFDCEVRTFSEPAPTCRALRKEKAPKKRKAQSAMQKSPVKTETQSHNPSEIQNGHISSTVVDSPSWRYDNFLSGRDINNCRNSIGYGNDNNFASHLPEFSIFKTPYSYTNGFSNHYNHAGILQGPYYSSSHYSQYNSATPNLLSHFNAHSNYSGYRISNPFDDFYPNNTLTRHPVSDYNKTFAEFTENTVQSDIKTKSVDIRYTDNRECFKDKDMGGVAIALTHGSVLFECAKHELHATTAIKKPNRQNPTRISLVFYQHRNLNKSLHGLDDYTLKQKSKVEGLQNEGAELSFDTSVEGCLNSSLESNGELIQRTATLPTYSLTTMFPMHPCIVTGPYQEFLARSLKMSND